MADILDLMVKIDLAMGGGWNSKVQGAAQALEGLQRKTQALNKTSSMIQGFEAQRQKAASTASSLQSLKQKLDAARSASLSAKNSTQALAVQYAAAQRRVQELSGKYPRQSLVMKLACQEAQRLKTAYSQSQAEAKRLEQAESTLSRQADQTAKHLSDERAKLLEMRSALREAGIGSRDMAKRQEELARAAQKAQAAQEKYSSIKSQLNWGNFKGDLIASAASVMALRAPVMVNKDFEQAMADVAAVARPTAEEFQALTDQAKLLGRTTQFTAMDAAHAQQNLIRSGMKASQVIEAMPAILNLSSAEGLSIDEASTIIAKGLGGMNLTAEMAPQLADAIAYASANSNTNVAMLGEAFKVAAPTLASQGVKFDQVAAYLGVLANKGYEGSEAGNALSSSFLRLARRPKQAENALTALGVRTRTRQGKMVELPEIMRQISAAFEKRKMGENQQLEYMGNIFGASYGAQMMAFMQAVKSGEAQSLETGVREKSAGWAAKSTSIRTNTLQGDLAGLSSAWEGLMNRIGQTLSPFVRQGVQWLTSLTNGLTDLIEKAGIWGDVVITIGGGLASWKVISTVWKYGSLLVKLPFAKLGVSLAEAGAQAALSGEKMGLWPSLLSKVSAAFTWLGNIILAHPLLALAGLVAVVVWLVIQRWETVKAWFKSWIPPNVWEKISTWCTETIDYIKGLWDDFYNWISEKSSKLNPFNWEMPSWLGGGNAGDNQVKNANIALGGYQPPEIKPHAAGGILTQPHIGLVAEAGPEAIIPLTDKARGMSLLERVAGVFGVNITPAGKSEKNEKISSLHSGVLNSRIFSQNAGDRVSSFMRDAGSRVSSFVSNNPVSSFMRSAGDRVSSFVNNNPVSSFMKNAGSRVSSFVNNNPVSSFMRSAGDRVSSFVSNNPVSSFMRNAGDRVSSFVRNTGDTSASHFVEQAGDFIGQRINHAPAVPAHSGMGAPARQTQSISPTINITVNSAPNDDPQGLADRIAQAVQDAIRELTSYQERVAFA